MKSQGMKEKYVAFLRGINVGGHRQVPMADLRNELAKLGFENITTVLNSGNIIFDTKVGDLKSIERTISAHLETYFNFPVPTIVRKAGTIYGLFHSNPFKNVKLTEDIRWYVSFLKSDTNTDMKLPWTSSDKSYKIIGKLDKDILSVLDLSVSRTSKAMEALEKYFGTDITT